ncbi:unnamed protein product [Protopolystoma xenopodis]|uniref:Uncharacterized protein n=1 Tax=Protopolystoma xenopodis TaxID=117903 RepID=A0A3S5FCV9_9PLAT|nr:unnamed protein product [Protopolystoma xenopodis]
MSSILRAHRHPLPRDNSSSFSNRRSHVSAGFPAISPCRGRGLAPSQIRGRGRQHLHRASTTTHTTDEASKSHSPGGQASSHGSRDASSGSELLAGPYSRSHSRSHSHSHSRSRSVSSISSVSGSPISSRGSSFSLVSCRSPGEVKFRLSQGRGDGGRVSSDHVSKCRRQDRQNDGNAQTSSTGELSKGRRNRHHRHHRQNHNRCGHYNNPDNDQQKHLPCVEVDENGLHRRRRRHRSDSHSEDSPSSLDHTDLSNETKAFQHHSRCHQPLTSSNHFGSLRIRRRSHRNDAAANIVNGYRDSPLSNSCYSLSSSCSSSSSKSICLDNSHVSTSVAAGSTPATLTIAVNSATATIATSPNASNSQARRPRGRPRRTEQLGQINSIKIGQTLSVSEVTSTLPLSPSVNASGISPIPKPASSSAESGSESYSAASSAICSSSRSSLWSSPYSSHASADASGYWSSLDAVSAVTSSLCSSTCASGSEFSDGEQMTNDFPLMANLPPSNSQPSLGELISHYCFLLIQL